MTKNEIKLTFLSNFIFFIQSSKINVIVCFFFLIKEVNYNQC